MSDRARAYQSQITGHTDEAYVVNGVKFDGVTDSGTLLDAKGPGYNNFLDSSGQFKNWWGGKRDFLEQAENQVNAANGNPIEWHFAEPEAAAATRQFFENEGVSGINIVVTPPLN